MFQLDDRIRVALAGPIKAGKDVLLEEVQRHKEDLLSCLEGNFWVPKKLEILGGEQNKELFEKYSTDPQRYTFEFQMSCLANRLAQQSQVDEASGLILLSQPLEIDYHVYAKANREYMGKSYPTYE